MKQHIEKKVKKGIKKPKIKRDKQGRFPKGVSGNPYGSPPKKNHAWVMKRILKDYGDASEIKLTSITNGVKKTEIIQFGSKKTLNDMAVFKLWQQCNAGDIKALKLLFLYTMGQPAPILDTNSDKPEFIKVLFDDAEKELMIKKTKEAVNEIVIKRDNIKNKGGGDIIDMDIVV